MKLGNLFADVRRAKWLPLGDDPALGSGDASSAASRKWNLRRLLSALSLVVLLIFAGACTGVVITPAPGSGKPATPPPPPQLTLEDLQNATYQGIYENQPVTLTDGKYEGEPFVEGGASRPTVTMVPAHAFGDVNGDGVEDAAVILVESSGGSGSFVYLAAVVNRDGQPANVATHLLGDRVQVDAIEIDDGEITLQTVTHGPDDPMCCPSQGATLVYALEGDQLVEKQGPQSAQPAATEAPVAVAGIYKGWYPGASSPGIDSTLYLNADQSLRLVYDYLNEDPPLVEVGTWEAGAAGRVVLTVTGQEDRDYENPEIINLTLADGVLATAEDDETYGELGRRWIRFDALARDEITVPYDAEVVAQTIENRGSFAGIYKAMLPAATCCGRDVTLFLNVDNSARLKTDFLNGEPASVEVGTWEAVGDAGVHLTLTGREDTTYDDPTDITFELQDGMLVAVAYDESLYGQAGLSFYHFRGLVAPIMPQ